MGPRMKPGLHPSGETKGHRALAALIDLARGSVQAPSPTRLDQGARALTASIAAGQARRIGWLRWSLVGATAAACVVAVLAIVSIARLRSPLAVQSPLTYSIEGGSVGDGGYLRELGSDGITLSFSEGTEFALMPGTRGRLRAVDGSGARIAIEHGTASFRVTPASKRRWLVEVGPFLVTVKGTVFTVSWDPSSERLDLSLRRGRVTVSGPVSGGDITLQAGQRLVVNLPASEALITEEKTEQAWGALPSDSVVPPTPGPSERPSPSAQRPAGRGAAAAWPEPSDAKVESERGWTEALASGQWDQILAEAEHGGVKATLEKAPIEDLFALADAARYRRHMDLARQTLLAARRRFPGSARSLDAAFLLGRVEEESDNGMEKAVRWYNAYLARAPRGTYASEALGRKMILSSKIGGTARAQPVAQEYLRRFPRGSYAGSARALRRPP